MKLVVDASILIDHINGRAPTARAIIYDALERGDELWSSFVTRTEVLAGMRPGEEHRTYDLLRVVNWAPVDRSESDAAAALGRRYLRTHPGIETPDLLLAELAQRLGAELVTMNVKHFPMFPELKRPYSY
jgi:predicted nucleic acid-binding protein